MKTREKKEVFQIITHRKLGYSINELVTKFHIPKTTVWRYAHSVKIPARYKKRILERQGGSKIRKEKAMIKAHAEAAAILASNLRYHGSLLAMLYWAEGSKKGLVFTNTDPRMIRLFLSLLWQVFKISKNETTLTIRYFTGMNKHTCSKYWAHAIGVRQNRIIMYYNDGGKRGKSPFGICRVSVIKGGFILKVIQSIIEQVPALVAQLD